MPDLYLVIEILGEPPFHKALNQSGYSGKDYLFFYNSQTHTHMRAYRRLEIYLAERVDMHKAANVWPLMPNMLTPDLVEPQCWTTAAPASEEKPKPVVADPNKVWTREELDAAKFFSLRKIASDLGIETEGRNKVELVEAILVQQAA
jgi:hypothetical protein